MADDNKIVTKKTTTQKAPGVPVAPGNPVVKKTVDPSGQDVKTTPVTKKSAPVRKTVARPAATAGNAAATPAPAAARAPKATTSAPTPAAKAPPAAATPPATAPKPVPSSTPASIPLAAKSQNSSPSAAVTAEEREAMIREAAYFIAEKHGFDSSFDSMNWEEATQQIDVLLAKVSLG